MERFVIRGGRPLTGTVTPGGNKNEALPVLTACLLTDQPIVLQNVPRIRDVLVMCEILEHIGVDVEWQGPHVLRLCAGSIGEGRLDPALCRRVRASILFAGPLLARLGRVALPLPGGDVIGRRRVDTHFHAIQALGASVEVAENHYEIAAPKGLEGADLFLDEASVTATENTLMAASLARGTTVLRNVACEPHVVGLADLLRKMGADITGAGTNTIVVRGVDQLGGATHELQSDYLEIGSWIGLAAVTGGEVTIERVQPESLRMISMTFRKLGVEIDIVGDRLRVAAGQSLDVRRDFHNHVPRIDDAPWPAFPTDLMSIVITVATQCSGTVLFFEKMFEGRMFFVDHLQNMGAQIILCDPHRVVVVGPTSLTGTKVESPDVRAGMAMLIAGLCARGETTIYNVHQIDRGYERIDEKLRALGADIDRLPA